jgi:hypothetical protein
MEPVFAGPAGRAWDVPLPDDPGAQVCQWLLDAPYAHPFWRWHVIAVVHLRPVAGEQEAHVQFPGASHELLLLALDPQMDDRIEPGRYDTQNHWLQPPDVVVQFIVADDDQAREVAKFAADAVTRGLVVPDSDFASHWEKAIHATAEHMRIGGHPGEGE